MDVEGFQDGVYVLTPEVDEDGEFASLESDLGLHGAVALDLRASGSGEFDELLEVLEVPLGSFPAGPAEVTPYLGINVRISGAAEAGAQLSVVAPFDVGAAIDKQEGGHAATSTGRPRFQPEIGLPDAANTLAFQVSVELELTMSFMLSISDITIGGPVLAASLGARLEVDLGSADWWVLQGLAGLEAGWSWPEADGSPQPPALEELFPRREWRIDDADDAGPAGDVSTRWSHSFGIHNGDDAGAIVAEGDELAIVERDNSNWMATLDGLGNPTWQEQQGNLVGYVDAVTRTADDDLVIAGTHSPACGSSGSTPPSATRGPSRSTSMTWRADSGRRSCRPTAA